MFVDVTGMSQAVLDLIAVAYDAYDETRAFLESLSFVDVPFTLTVIDNQSPDQRMKGLLSRFAVANGQCVDHKVIFNAENVGFAHAVNQGMDLTHAPFAAILNCDTRFVGDAASKIVDMFHARPEVAVIGPRTTTSSGALTHAGIVRFSNGRDQHRGWLHYDQGQFNDTLSVSTVSGATYFVRRSVWNELRDCEIYKTVAPGARGAFLPTRHYYEETWFSYHARAHGYDVVYAGGIHMIHEWHRSSPLGGIGEQVLGQSEAYFKEACKAHNIELTW